MQIPQLIIVEGHARVHILNQEGEEEEEEIVTLWRTWFVSMVRNGMQHMDRAWCGPNAILQGIRAIGQ